MGRARGWGGEGRDAPRTGPGRGWTLAKVPAGELGAGLVVPQGTCAALYGPVSSCHWSSTSAARVAGWSGIGVNIPGPKEKQTEVGRLTSA